MTGAEIYIRFFPQNHLFAERYLRNAPPCLSFVLPKERQRRARWKKERAPSAGNSGQCVRSYARLSNLVQVWYKVHAGLPRRPQCCLGHKPRAAAACVGKAPSEEPLSVSEMRAHRPRLTALAATLVAPLGSPSLRGVQRTLPLVAFLWSTRHISFLNRKEMCLDLHSFVTANTQTYGDKLMLFFPPVQ